MRYVKDWLSNHELWINSEGKSIRTQMGDALFIEEIDIHNLVEIFDLMH
jgi:hypothetical protein